MNITNLKADTDFLCGSTSATYPDADKIRNFNVHYHDTARMIWESDGSWWFDDANNSDLPVAYRTVANASGAYLIPTSAIRVEGVEIKDNAGDWTKLKPITYHEMSLSPEEFLSTPGLPVYYELQGTQIRLYPAPGTGYVTMTSGMAVRLNRNVTEFPVTAASVEPGFPAAFHRILSIGASMDFIKDTGELNKLANQKARLEKGLCTFYSKRGADFKTVIKPKSPKWRNYV